jgi:hypothetical protein
MADARLSIFILVIALAAFDPGRRKKWFFVCGVMAASLHLLDVTQNFIRSQASIETTLEALASIPPGSKVLPLVRRPANEHLQRAPTVHLWAYGVIRKNWISPYLFHGEGVLPLEATSTLYIPRWVDADGRFAVPLNWDRVRVQYDYIWADNIPDLAPDLARIAQPVVQKRLLRIYRVNAEVPSSGLVDKK